MRVSHLTAHARRHTPEAANRYPCPEPGCPMGFSTNQRLHRHQLIHSSERPYGCARFYLDENALRAHVRHVHSDRPRFVCPHSTCGKSYAYKRSLKNHVSRVHLQTSGAEPKHRKPPAAPIRPVPTRLPTALEIASGMAYADPELSGRAYPCTVPGCGFRFKRRSELTTHAFAVHDQELTTTEDEASEQSDS
ncbi:hypothetical protein GGF46_003444 [Coemansia sp. RSA 552]|nr:hypothetical protein GGF46_003444 [Coemansia sp. RSA 552]